MHLDVNIPETSTTLQNLSLVQLKAFVDEKCYSRYYWLIFVIYSVETIY